MLKNAGWEAFARAAQGVNEALERTTTAEPKRAVALMHEMIECLRPISTDEIDAANLAADLFKVHAYIASSRLAAKAGHPAPKLPRFSSEFARGFVRRGRMLLVSLVQRLSEKEIARVGAILRTLDQDHPDLLSSDPIPVAIVWWLFSMHPDDAASWIRANLDDVERRLAS